MYTQILQAINYIRHVSKKKVTIDKIVTYLNSAGVSNWDKEPCKQRVLLMKMKMISL